MSDSEPEEEVSIFGSVKVQHPSSAQDIPPSNAAEPDVEVVQLTEDMEVRIVYHGSHSRFVGK